MERQQTDFSLWYLILTTVAILILQFYIGTANTQTLAYSDFKALLKAEKVRSASVGETEISGTVATAGLDTILPRDQAAAMQQSGRPEHAFTTVRINDPNLLSDMDAAHVRYAGEAGSKWIGTLLSWIVPALVFLGIWSLVIRRMGGGGSSLLEIGKSKAKVYLQKQTGVTFADVAGIDEAKAELMEVVDFLRGPQRYRRRAHGANDRRRPPPDSRRGGRATLSAQRPLLDVLAQTLLGKEVVDRTTLDALLRRAPAQAKHAAEAA